MKFTRKRVSKKRMRSKFGHFEMYVGNTLHFAIVLLEKATEGGSGSSDGDGRSRRSSSRSTASPSSIYDADIW